MSRNLASVMNTDGYRHMTRSCPQLQAEILATIATSLPNVAAGGGGGQGGGQGGERQGGERQGGGGHRVAVRQREGGLAAQEEEVRRVRPRRE